MLPRLHIPFTCVCSMQGGGFVRVLKNEKKNVDGFSKSCPLILPHNAAIFLVISDIFNQIHFVIP